MMKPGFVTRGILPGLVAVIGAASLAQAADETPVTRCAALKSFAWPGLVVEEARLVPAGPAEPQPDGARGASARTQIPEHCLFRALIASPAGAQGQKLGVGIDVRLPSSWNRRFAFEGGGGLDGILRPAYGSVWGTINPPALSRGFAVASTDGSFACEKERAAEEDTRCGRPPPG